MSEMLPNGWVVSTLDNIADWGSGGTPKATEKKYYNGNIPWLIIADLNNGIVYRSSKQITEIGLHNSSAKWVEIGSVLIAMYGSIGKLGIAGIRCTTNQAIAFTSKIWGGIPNWYLFHYLKYKEPDLLSIGQGGAQKNISQTILKQYPIPLPPLNEQKRIVAKLDQIIPRVDRVNERLDKIPAIIKRFRQSVLTAAVTGKLTEKWRETQVLSEWEEKLSGELFSFVTSGSRGWAQYYSESGSLFLRITNLDHLTINLDLKKQQYVKLPNGAEGMRTRVQPSDILISITADVGMIGLIPEPFEEAYINQHISLARPIEAVYPFYLAWYLASFEGQSQFQDLQKGATKVGLGLDDIKNINIPSLPSKNKKRSYVRLTNYSPWPTNWNLTTRKQKPGWINSPSLSSPKPSAVSW